MVVCYTLKRLLHAQAGRQARPCMQPPVPPHLHAEVASLCDKGSEVSRAQQVVLGHPLLQQDLPLTGLLPQLPPGCLLGSARQHKETQMRC